MPSFRGDKFFLSNMFPCPFMVGTTVYKSAEHFFQAHLTATANDFQAILNTADGWAAKRLAKTLPRCRNYKEIRVAIMAEALMFKFLAHSNLRSQLLSTPDNDLLEENEWHYNFWGRCICAACRQKGGYKNTLGMLLRLTKNYFASIESLNR